MGLPVGRQMVAGRRRTDGLQLVEDIAQQAKSDLDAVLLPLRDARQPVVRALQEARLERAIGVIYRPETELASHYFNASLPNQFDEYIWFDETRAIAPLGPETGEGAPGTFPFGL
jgi:erythromycin esterase-like protein